MKRNVILTPAQKIKFDKLIAQSKFNRIALEILSDKRLSVDSRARKILDLKVKLFGKK